MKSPLNILHLEDDLQDAAFIRSTLTAAGIACSIKRIQTRADFVAALESGGIDLILSDHELPAFNSSDALKIAQKMRPDLPFIVVSGTIGEELAIETLKSGATDYVLKERLSRLVPAVRRAMAEAETSAERKRLEAQFIEAQKMEVVGHLAGGVAHDFNNILGIILGYSDLVLGELPANSPLQEHVQQIRHAAERATGLTRQLLVFSRKQVVQMTVIDLNDVVVSLEKMLRRLIDENIELTIRPSGGSSHINADSGYVGQLLMNMAINARDAMSGGGKLIIRVQNVTLEEADAQPERDIKSGHYVMLSVTDTGTGMTDEVKSHIFEAFFTTKPKGKGTGLGLATCQTVAKQCGGHIDVESEVGRGTTFKIYFPQVAQLSKPITPTLEQTTSPRGTETLLLVEDEPGIRQLAAKVLRGQGYEVLTASNGQEGLRVASQHHGAPIRLAVTDVVMPKMSGKVMAEWLKSSYPNLKILFTSGYTDDAIAQHEVIDPSVAFLHKPYTPATLAAKVREVLDTPQK